MPRSRGRSPCPRPHEPRARALRAPARRASPAGSGVVAARAGLVDRAARGDRARRARACLFPAAVAPLALAAAPARATGGRRDCGRGLATAARRGAGALSATQCRGAARRGLDRVPRRTRPCTRPFRGAARGAHRMRRTGRHGRATTSRRCARRRAAGCGRWCDAAIRLALRRVRARAALARGAPAAARRAARRAIARAVPARGAGLAAVRGHRPSPRAAPARARRLGGARRGGMPSAVDRRAGRRALERTQPAACARPLGQHPRHLARQGVRARDPAPHRAPVHRRTRRRPRGPCRVRLEGLRAGAAQLRPAGARRHGGGELHRARGRGHRAWRRDRARRGAPARDAARAARAGADHRRREHRGRHAGARGRTPRAAPRRARARHRPRRAAHGREARLGRGAGRTRAEEHRRAHRRPLLPRRRRRERWSASTRHSGARSRRCARSAASAPPPSSTPGRSALRLRWRWPRSSPRWRKARA